MTGAKAALGIAAAALAAAGLEAIRREPTPPGSGAGPASTVLFVSSPVGAEGTGARIVAAPLDGGGPPRVLTAGFAEARAPRVSADGREILFAGRRTEGERMGVWAMGADGGSPRRLADGDGGPAAWLPDGRIAFAGGGALRAVAADGTGLQSLTFHAEGTARDPSVLADGRILFVHGREGSSVLLAVHNDGTGIHAFHGPGLPPALLRRPREGGDRAVWAVADGRVLRVDARRPERAGTDGAPGLEGEVAAAEPLPCGGLLVSVRPPAAPSFGLRLAGPGGRVVADDPGRDETDPVLLAPRPRPKGHLSVVKPAMDRGRLYAVDARRTARGLESPVPARVRFFESLGGGERLLGEVPLAPDGSFYAEVPADRPLRAEALDASGAAIRGSGFSFWVRPNEIRACIGCHEDPAAAPPNVLPAAVQGEPVDLVPR